MNIARISVIFWALFFLLVLILPATGSPLDDNWADGFHMNGINGKVEAVASFEGKIAVGGAFQRAGLTSASNIALYDPLARTFASMGDGFESRVLDLCVFHGELWALVEAGGESRKVWCWADGHWEIMGPSEVFLTNSMCVYQDSLYAGPYQWNGSGWEMVFEPSSTILCQIVWNDLMVVGGYFTELNGMDCNYIGVWNGESVASLGSGLNHIVNSLDLYEDDLLVGGWFSAAGELSLMGLARWDGTDWMPIYFANPPFSNVRIDGMGVWQGRIYAVAYFWTTMVGRVQFLVHDGINGWSVFSDRLSWDILDFEVVDDTLWLGGTFAGINEVASRGLISLSDSGLNPTMNSGSGFSGFGGGLCVYQDRLYIAGEFSYGGAAACRNVAWLGELAAWHPAEFAYIDGEYQRFPEYSHFDKIVSNGDDMWASFMDYGGGNELRYIANINSGGWTWSCTQESRIPGAFLDDTLFSTETNQAFMLGEGYEWISVTGPCDSNVQVIRDWNGMMVFAGGFSSMGGIPVQGIVGWDGQWVYFPPGVEGTVSSLGEFQEDLVVGMANGTSTVKRWDGNQWHEMPGTFSGAIKALVQYGDHLYAGGEFSSVDGQPAGNLAYWNGENWLPYGIGVTGPIVDMEVYAGRLYCLGNFYSAGSTISDHLACLEAPLEGLSGVQENQAVVSCPLLKRAIPNPFNPRTRISFDLPTAGYARLAIYDVRGHLVMKLADGILDAGEHHRDWDGADAEGRAMPSGVYFAKLLGVGEEQSLKITLTR